MYALVLLLLMCVSYSSGLIQCGQCKCSVDTVQCIYKIIDHLPSDIGETFSARAKFVNVKGNQIRRITTTELRYYTNSKVEIDARDQRHGKCVIVPARLPENIKKVSSFKLTQHLL